MANVPGAPSSAALLNDPNLWAQLRQLQLQGSSTNNTNPQHTPIVLNFYNLGATTTNNYHGISTSHNPDTYTSTAPPPIANSHAYRTPQVQSQIPPGTTTPNPQGPRAPNFSSNRTSAYPSSVYPQIPASANNALVFDITTAPATHLFDWGPHIPEAQRQQQFATMASMTERLRTQAKTIIDQVANSYTYRLESVMEPVLEEGENPQDNRDRKKWKVSLFSGMAMGNDPNIYKDAFPETIRAFTDANWLIAIPCDSERYNRMPYFYKPNFPFWVAPEGSGSTFLSELKDEEKGSGDFYFALDRVHGDQVGRSIVLGVLARKIMEAHPNNPQYSQEWGAVQAVQGTVEFSGDLKLPGLEGLYKKVTLAKNPGIRPETRKAIMKAFIMEHGWTSKECPYDERIIFRPLKVNPAIMQWTQIGAGHGGARTTNWAY